MNVVELETERPQWPIFAAVDLNLLKQRSGVLKNACDAIIAKCDAEKRDLTSEEDNRLADLIFQQESVAELIGRLESENETYPSHKNMKGMGRRTTPQGPEDVDYRVDSILPRAQGRGTRSATAPLLLGKTREGEEILGFRPGQPLPVSGPQLSYDLGAWARAAYSGDWQSIRAQSQTEGVGTDGGFLVPPRLSQEVMELIRNRAQVLRAGAITTPMDSSTLSFARQISDPTVGFRGELQALPASKITFDMVNFRAHAIGVYHHSQ
jgi:HK97 family phage major capsid protein